MKRFLGLAFLSCFLLGCNDDYVEQVKSDPVLNYSALTYGDVLDKRKLCESVQWTSEKIRNTPTVTYTCRLRNNGTATFSEVWVWENSRAMNGFDLKEARFIQVDTAGEETTQTLDFTQLMYAAVYDLTDMGRYLELHFSKKQ